MPWLSIISWLVTFLLSASKKGVSAGKAAMIATGVAAGTYYLADPSNADNFLGIGRGSKAIPGDPEDVIYTKGASTSEAAANAGRTVVGALGSLAEITVHETGKTLRSWGPLGTVGAIAGVSALTSDKFAQYLPWIIGGGAVLLLTK